MCDMCTCMAAGEMEMGEGKGGRGRGGWERQ